MWEQDALEMKALGLTYVRIGEFAWSRFEPRDGVYDLAWFDQAIDTLSSVGLKIVIGTPTATPPKWLIDKYPEILPVDPETGQTRGFGSRRHYDFSSEIYEREALRITEKLAERYGGHKGVTGWQTDNELSCHDTTLSVSKAAKAGFQKWCKGLYGDVSALNKAWGNIFWSMEYKDFHEIDVPFGAVTEVNPAHMLAFYRYSSDQVIDFHRKIAAVIRKHSPGRWITHNFIPKEDMDVDTFELGRDIDFASYDNYPLGRTCLMFEQGEPDIAKKYLRSGHPDLSTFYHDTSRSFAAGDFWVMEQQPGPVNWAPSNARPEKGMVRLWSMEAFAHGAACVSYFRWRQAPFAQEQMHAGLKRPDNEKAAAWAEVEQVRRDINAIGLSDIRKEKAKVAIVTDVQGLWVSKIQSQATDYNCTRVEFEYYSALRQLGLDVDFVSKDTPFEGYELIVAPCLPILDEGFVKRARQSEANFVFGPMAGAKTPDFTIPENLAPGFLQDLIPIRVTSVETLSTKHPRRFAYKGSRYEAKVWCEEIEADGVAILARFGTDEPAVVRSEKYIYIATLADNAFLKDFFEDVCADLNIETVRLPEDIRISRRGGFVFAFNYSDQEKMVPAKGGSTFLIGAAALPPREIAVWREGK
jgi:beta-galactosidase